MFWCSCTMGFVGELCTPSVDLETADTQYTDHDYSGYGQYDDDTDSGGASALWAVLFFLVLSVGSVCIVRQKNLKKQAAESSGQYNVVSSDELGNVLGGGMGEYEKGLLSPCSKAVVSAEEAAPAPPPEISVDDMAEDPQEKASDTVALHGSVLVTHFRREPALLPFVFRRLTARRGVCLQDAYSDWLDEPTDVALKPKKAAEDGADG